MDKKQHNCPKCPFRAKYDRNTSSFLGKIWRWHANWCPGWKKYMYSLSDNERNEIALKYGMEKFRR